MGVSRVTTLEHDGIGTTVSAMAVAPDGSRAYLAARGGHLGELLAVVDLVDGQPEPARWCRIQTDTLPPGQPNEAIGLHPDPAGGRLYLALSQGTPHAAHNLGVIDLVDGEPAGLGRVHDGGLKNPNLTPSPPVNAMVRHPHKPILYVVGGASPGVAVHTLDADGDPTSSTWVAVPSPANTGRHDVAIDAEGRRLYLSAYPNQLHVVDLDAATGMPQPSTLRTYDFGRGPDDVDGYLLFTLTDRAVYRHRRAGTGVPNWPLQLWRLDAAGLPVGSGPESFPALTGRCAAVSPDGDTLLVVQDATTVDQVNGGDPRHSGSALLAAALDASGRPGPATEVRRLPRRSELPGRPVLAAVTDAGAAAVLAHDMRAGSPVQFIANEVAGWYLRIKPEAVAFGTGPVLPTLRFVLLVPGTMVLDPVTVGSYSDWTTFPLDPFLAGHAGRRLFQFDVRVGGTNNGVDLERLDLLFEVVAPPLVEGQEPRVVAAVRETVTGTGTGSTVQTATPTTRIHLLLPGFDVGRGDRAAGVESLSGYAERRQQAAEAVAVPEAHRPHRYPLSASMVAGAQGSSRQLVAEVRALRALGLTTAIVQNWPGLSAQAVDQVLQSHGLTLRSAAVYSLPAIFDFDAPSMAPAALRQWAGGIVAAQVDNNGAEPAEIINVKMADEPGLYLPSTINDPRWAADSGSGWLAAFHDYLQQKGHEPGDLGADEWADVWPIGAGGVDGTDGTRRLFRESVRFLVESFAGAAAGARRALDAELPGPALLAVNTNNVVNRWYKGYPNVAGDKNPDNPNAGDPAIGPNLATLGFDWAHAARTGAFDPFSNVTTPDHQAQYAAYLGDALRSAAQRGGRAWAAYLKANALGTNPEGPSYKTLALVGRGAALVDLFSWGPGALVGADGWSDLTGRYRHIARAVGLVGQAEPYLLDTTPATGSVAVLGTGGSELWDPDHRRYRYDTEVEYLHSAVTHAGYPVDLVDEPDLEQGALRHYDALYVTSPNLSVAAQHAVAAWVATGGVLAVTPGAATADELDRPVTVLDAVLGLAERDRTRFADEAATAAGTLTFTPDPLGTGPFPFPPRVGRTMRVAGPVTPLHPSTADAVAAFDGTGMPAVSVHRHGRGLAVAYGFFPGLQYDRSADRGRITRLPAGWGRTERAAVAGPATAAGAARPVEVALAGVEACRLDATTSGRSAVILLNWGVDPTPGTDVRIHRTAATTVRSVRHGPLPAALDGSGTLRTKVPVDDVDILLVG